MIVNSTPLTSSAQVSSINTALIIDKTNGGPEYPIETADKTALVITVAGSVKLDLPSQEATPQQLDKIAMQLKDGLNDLMDDLLILLVRYAQQARQQGIELRNIEQRQVLASQGKQLAEMRSAAGTMIASAFFSAFSAVITLGVGIKGAVSSVKNIRLEYDLKAGGSDQHHEFKAIADRAGRNIQRISEITMTANSTNQSVTATATASVSVQQQFSNANAKESEIQATNAQYERQKAEDQVSHVSNLMKEALEFIKEWVRNKAQVAHTVIS